MKFLETLLDGNLNYILVKIDEIKCVTAGQFEDGKKIIIHMNDYTRCEESFDTLEAFESRYEYIKQLLEAD